MGNSGFWGLEKNNLNIASLDTSNIEGGPTVFNRTSIQNYGFKGATGIYSTSNDMFQLYKSIISERILKKESVESMWKLHILITDLDTLQYGYGLGWGVVSINNKLSSVSHIGDESFGHNAFVRFYSDGHGFVIMSNSGQIDEESWSVEVGRMVIKLLNI